MPRANQTAGADCAFHTSMTFILLYGYMFCINQRAWQSDSFAQNRMDQLGLSLNDALERPGYASHPAVRIFLELEDQAE